MFNWSCPWRRGQDLNLRSLLGDTRFPSEHHKPLGHLSLLNYFLFGAGSGNRTRNLCLGSTCFATKLYLHLAETVGFEPTCRLLDNRISSAAQYDRFDTSPSGTIILQTLVKINCYNKNLSKLLDFFLSLIYTMCCSTNFELNLITWKVG